MEFGIWNIQGNLWSANTIAYSNAPALYANRIPQFPFHNAQISALPEIFKTNSSRTINAENEGQQSEFESNDSSSHSNISQQQRETQAEPNTDNDNAADFINNFGLNNFKIENFAFINQQFNPVYSLMLNHFNQQQEFSNSENEIDETQAEDGYNESNLSKNDAFECTVCQTVLKSNEELQRHLEVKHFNNEVVVSTRSFVQNESTIDGKLYNENSNSSTKRQDRLSLQRVCKVRYEREEYRCTLCPYTCTIEKAFYRHLRAHSNDSNDTTKTGFTPRISCVICGKDRTSENEMLKHMQKHKDNRHFCCDICVFRTVQLKKME
ncbi:RE1-silencing transcription factor-like isoform X2 [Ctenocephalides felis]|uniref:RE1-silencing transcription factor-like isoform X2 n=1 Tax=Ctenocephalides felis TaxID=7515 RepID=UPI000E6E487A|nr:RE1-silencing transcription factor-like isoform X2 [Ctenocephalides felis]